MFLTEVLIGERVGLLPLDERYWTVYFLHLPIACFDSRNSCMLPLPKHENFDTDEAGEEGTLDCTLGLRHGAKGVVAVR